MPGFPFLKLPLELRWEIYTYFLNNGNHYVQYPADPAQPSAYKNLLLCCRQINIEAKPFLLRKTPALTFTFPHPIHLIPFLLTLSPKIPLENIRHLGIAYPSAATLFTSSSSSPQPSPQQPSQPTKPITLAELLLVVPGLSLDTLTPVTALFSPASRRAARASDTPRIENLLRKELLNLAQCRGWRKIRCIGRQDSANYTSSGRSTLDWLAGHVANERVVVMTSLGGRTWGPVAPIVWVPDFKAGDVERAQAVWPLEEGAALEKFGEEGWVLCMKGAKEGVGRCMEVQPQTVSDNRGMRIDVVEEVRERLAAHGGSWERVVEECFQWKRD